MKSIYDVWSVCQNRTLRNLDLVTSVYCDVTLYTGYVKIGLEINRIELNKFERCSEVRWLLWISCELQHFGDKFENMFTTRFVGNCTILRNDHVLMLSVIDPLYIAVAFIVNLKRFLLWFGFIYETQSQICNS